VGDPGLGSCNRVDGTVLVLRWRPREDDGERKKEKKIKKRRMRRANLYVSYL
jgi:hypothetical protein